MGYDVHITRRQNWFDEDEPGAILLQEWKDLVARDPEMRLDSFAETATAEGEVVSVESDGLSVWTSYSGGGIEGNHAWFNYYKGTIVVKNPDEEILHKMIEIARILNAQVQGDDGEVYGGSASMIAGRHSASSGDDEAIGRKPWWRFW